MPNCGPTDTEFCCYFKSSAASPSLSVAGFLAADEQNMAHIEPLIDAQPAAQILGLLPVTQRASVPNGSIESHADRTLGDQFPDATRHTEPIHRAVRRRMERRLWKWGVAAGQSEVRPL